MGAIKYTFSYLFIVLGYWSLIGEGLQTFALVIFSFVLIPFLELVLPPNKSENRVRHLWVYDLVLYSLIPMYLILFVFFLATISNETDLVSLVGKVSAMGMLCGIFGINMAHELGHRLSKVDRFFAQLLLATSQYTHFYIEHNRGHHKRIGTPEDPATARKNENLYRFWIRVIKDSYLSAWELEKQRLKRSGVPYWSIKNAMVRYAVVQIIIVIAILLFGGPKVTMCYLAAALFGIILLETINYIEHYGLVRKKIGKTAYERVQVVHSWNSDHMLGRFLLFELTRHSHHHENSLKKYPELTSKENASQLPAGYPAMMVLSLFPPLWFRVMNKRLPSNS